MPVLQAPEVLRSYLDEEFDPHVPALRLRWGRAAADPAERIWELPEGVSIVGPSPERFGIHIERWAADGYSVRLLWNRTVLSWSSVTRVQLLTSSLAPLLRAIGTDLWQVLAQPIHPSSIPLPAAA